MELQLVKQPGGFLRPANQVDSDALSKVANGRLIVADIKQPRNPLFHRKFFALLNFAFEYWEPACEEVKGMKPEKNFERFRKDVLISAGFRSLVVNIKNEVRWEAESISFSNMDEVKFSEVYRHVFNVLWELVFRHVNNMTRETAERTMEDLLRFE